MIYLLWILLETLIDKVHCLFRKVSFKFGNVPAIRDCFKGTGGPKMSQWRVSCQQLKHGNPKWPDISFRIVPVLFDHLWCHPIRRPNHWASPHPTSRLAGHTKVTQPDVAILGYQNIGSLYIPMNYVVSMKIGQSFEDLFGDKWQYLFWNLANRFLLWWLVYSGYVGLY